MQVKEYIMSKVKLRIKLNEYEDIIDGIFIDNKIKFLLDKKIVTITINDNNIIMERRHNDNEYTYICFDEINPKAYYFYNNELNFVYFSVLRVQKHYFFLLLF